jgi:hypothetical protein
MTSRAKVLSLDLWRNTFLENNYIFYRRDVSNQSSRGHTRKTKPIHHSSFKWLHTHMTHNKYPIQLYQFPFLPFFAIQSSLLS